MQKLSRREALRGTGVAALAAGVAVVPLVGVDPCVDSHAKAKIDLAVRPLKDVRSPNCLS